MSLSSALFPARPIRRYDRNFRADPTYRDRIPDIQNSGDSAIEGANVPIIQVGISDFRLPLNIRSKDGTKQHLETSVIGTVGLQKDFKGINMSRIMRVFYEFKDRSFDVNTLGDVLDAYRLRLNSASPPRSELLLPHDQAEPALRIGRISVL
jgi:GTP cyclohydrolase I